MKLNSIINPIWENLSEKLFKSFFEKYRTQTTGTSLTLENSTGDDLVDLTIGGNTEQNSPYNVRSGSMTLEEVPERWRSDVEEALSL